MNVLPEDVYDAESEIGKLIAERDMQPKDSRTWLEIDFQIEKLKAIEYWREFNIVEVDEKGWKKAEEVDNAYEFVVRLDGMPYDEWQSALSIVRSMSLFKMKPTPYLTGDRLSVLVSESDNLQNHLDFLKVLVESTNEQIRLWKPEMLRHLERNCQDKLKDFDVIESLKKKSSNLKL